MTDSTRQPEHDPRRGPSDDAATAKGSDGLDDTTVLNPLRPEDRQHVAQWLRETAEGFKVAILLGPDPGELAELGMKRPEWVRRLWDEAALQQRLAEVILRDRLAFRSAAQVRNLLNHVDRHDLTAASAALDDVLAAALPDRLHAYRREAERLRQEHGFYIQVVGGRGDPLPLPTFAYTVGLTAKAAHPELVIVGMPSAVASALLNDLGRTIIAGGRALRAGEDLEDLLTNGYKVRVRECPSPLAAAMGQGPTTSGDPFQLLLPDPAGRFPGDRDVDPRWERSQQYPDHPV